MNRFIPILLLSLGLLGSCQKKQSSNGTVHFQPESTLTTQNQDPEYSELIYLPIYGDIYYVDESRTFPLTTTISLRNMSPTDSVYVYSLDYYDTKGHILKEYLSTSEVLPLAPLETYDMVVDSRKYKGGTGANFIVKWGRTKGEAELLVQAVMISTSRQQGLSFITEGKRIQSFTGKNK